MTANLQIVLAVIGVFIVAVIYLLSRWQDRKRFPWNRPAGSVDRAARRDAPVLDDRGAGFAQHEIPLLNIPTSADSDETPLGESEAAAEQSDAWHAETDESLANVSRLGSGAPASSSRRAPVPSNSHDVEGFVRLSQIDYWVKITGDRDVGRESVLAIYRAGVGEFTRTHSIHGLKMPEKAWRDLEQETEDSRFGDLVATIQLADRTGAISNLEMTRFSALVSRLSEGTGREFTFMTTVENAFAQAAAIAKFVTRFDCVFAVTVRPESQSAEPFQGAAIDRCALQMGLERDGERYYSRFKIVGKSRVSLYSLADMSETGQFDFDDMKSFSTRDLIFFTRPAVNRSPGAVFAEMVDTAKSFAARNKGVVSLPGYDDFTQEGIEETRKSIEQLAEEMARLGIPAGSDEAARIF